MTPVVDLEQQQSGRPQCGRFLYIAALLLTAFLRMWLTADEDIRARHAAYDDLWFVKSAEVAYWGVETQNHLSAIRPPAYPLWLWMNQNLGIPQRIAIDLAFVSSALLLVYALRHVGMPRLWAWLTFVVIAFLPEAFRVFSLILSDAFAVPLMTALCGSLIMLLCTGRTIRWGVVTGIFASLFALNRGEGGMMAHGLLACLAGLLFLRAMANRQGFLPSVWGGVRVVIVPLVVMLAVTHLVKYVNYRVYGVYATNDLSAPGHASMMTALTSIDAPEKIDYVTISRTSLAMAYEVSPSLRELQTYLDGQVGDRWHKVTRQRRASLPPGEIISGYNHWALREAAYRAGKYTSIADADAFYAQIAREIRQAIEDGKIPGRLVISSYLDPDYGRWIPRLPASFQMVWQRICRNHEGINTLVDSSDVTANVSEAFDRVALRRKGLAGKSIAKFSGELITNGVRPRSLHILNGAGSLALAKIDLDSRRVPDTSPPQYVSPFEVEINGANPSTMIQWRVQMPENKVYYSRRPVPQRQQQFGFPEAGKSIRVDIKSAEVQLPEPTLRLGIRRWLDKTYRTVLPGIVYTGLGISAVALLLRRRKVNGLWLCCSLLLAAAVLSRLGLFTIIDATGWHGHQPRYTFAVVPAMLGGAMLLIHGGAREIFNVFLKKKPDTDPDPAVAVSNHA